MNGADAKLASEATNPGLLGIAETTTVVPQLASVDHGQVEKPAMSGALRLALAEMGRPAAPRGDKVRPRPSIRTVMLVWIGLIATIAWTILLAWLIARIII